MRAENSLSDASPVAALLPQDSPNREEKKHHHSRTVVSAASTALAFTAFGLGTTAQAQTKTAADNMTSLIFGIQANQVAGWDARVEAGQPSGVTLANHGFQTCIVDPSQSPAKNADTCIAAFGLYGSDWVAPAFGVDSGNGQVPVMGGASIGDGGAIIPRCSDEYTNKNGNEVVTCNLWIFAGAPTPAAPSLKTLGAPGDVPGNALAGDSVVTGAGNLYQVYRDFPKDGVSTYGPIDLDKLSPSPLIKMNPNHLTFERYYNSGKPIAGGEADTTALGAGWTHSFSGSLGFSSAGGAVYEITANLPTGQSLIFFPTKTAGVWSTDADMDYTLTQSGTGANATWVLVGPDDTADAFNANGQWQSRTLRSGYTLTGTYNSSNQLSAVTDSDGQMLQLSYNTKGFLTQVTTPDNVITFAPENGQLASVTYSSTASPNTTPYQTYSYTNHDFPFFMTSRTNGNGVTDLTVGAETYGRVSSIQKGDSTAPARTYIYNNSTSIEVTTETGVQQTFTLTQVLNVLKPTQIDQAASPDGTTGAGTWKFGYDPTYGRPNDIVNSNGYETTIKVTSHDLPTQIIEAKGKPEQRETDITPDASDSRLPAEIKLVGVLDTKFGTYTRGVPATITETDLTGNTTGAAATRVIGLTEDGEGRVASVTHARPDLTTPASDVLTWTKGILGQYTDPSGNSTTATATTASGVWSGWTTPNTSVVATLNEVNLTTEKDTTGIVNGAKVTLKETQSYDPAYFQQKTVFADGESITKTPNSQGNTTKATDGAGNYIQYDLGPLDNATQASFFKANGTLVRTVPTPSDAMGRPLADGKGNNWTLDLEGNLTSFNKATFELNGLGYATSSTDENGTTGIGRSLRGNITSLTPPGETTPSVIITRDGFAAENPVKIFSTNSGTETDTYNGDDGKVNTTFSNGNLLQRTRDANNRVTQLTAKDGSITFAYDVPGSNVVGTDKEVSGTSTNPNWISYKNTYDILALSSQTDIYSSSIQPTTTYTHTKTGADGGYVLSSGTAVAYQRSGSDLTGINVTPPGASAATQIKTTADPFGGPVTQETDGTILAKTTAMNIGSQLTGQSATLNGAKVVDLTITPAAGTDNLISAVTGTGSVNFTALGYQNGVLNSAAGPSTNWGANLDKVGTQTGVTGSEPLTFTVAPNTSQITNVSNATPTATVQAPTTNERDSGTVVASSASHGNGPGSASPPDSGGSSPSSGSGAGPSSGNAFHMSGTNDGNMLALEIGAGVFGALALTTFLMGDDRRRKFATAALVGAALVVGTVPQEGCGGGGGGTTPPPQKEQTPDPTFTPGSETSSVPVQVTISDPGATIYVTTDGTTPTTSSKVYSSPITVSTTETIKALATISGDTNSNVVSATYTITPVVATAATPTFAPNGGTFTSAQTVTIADTTAGAAVYFTTDGSTPTTNSTLYNGPITVAATEKLQAIAAAPGDTNSAVAAASFTINQPTISTNLKYDGSGNQTIGVTPVTTAASTANLTIGGGNQVTAVSGPGISVATGEIYKVTPGNERGDLVGITSSGAQPTIITVNPQHKVIAENTAGTTGTATDYVVYPSDVAGASRRDAAIVTSGGGTATSVGFTIPNERGGTIAVVDSKSGNTTWAGSQGPQGEDLPGGTGTIMNNKREGRYNIPQAGLQFSYTAHSFEETSPTGSRYVNPFSGFGAAATKQITSSTDSNSYLAPTDFKDNSVIAAAGAVARQLTGNSAYYMTGTLDKPGSSWKVESNSLDIFRQLREAVTSSAAKEPVATRSAGFSPYTVRLTPAQAAALEARDPN